MIEKNIIVAVSDNWAIGKDGGIPWHISEDLKYFRDVTFGHPVIMGSKTYKSIGHPLSGRVNIVISHKYDWDGVIVENSLDAAYKKAEQFDNQCFVIGGGSIYREAMKSADRIYLTHIRGEFDADTFFPKIDTNEWKMISSSDVKVDKESGIPYNFEIYIRK